MSFDAVSASISRACEMDAPRSNSGSTGRPEAAGSEPSSVPGGYCSCEEGTAEIIVGQRSLRAAGPAGGSGHGRQQVASTNCVFCNAEPYPVKI